MEFSIVKPSESLEVQTYSDPEKKTDLRRKDEIETFKYKDNSSMEFPRPCPESTPKYDPLKNLYDVKFKFDLRVCLSESEENLYRENQLIWTQRNLAYGDVRSRFSFRTNVSVSERIRDHNGSLYLHVYLTKSGFLPGPRKDDSLSSLYTLHKVKRLNFYWKSNDSSVRSYWPSNWTVNLVETEGRFNSYKLAGREKEFIACDPLTNKYYPLLYLNDNFNLAKDCIQINRTTEWLPLNLTFRQISLAQLEKYLEQRTLEERFRNENLPYEDSVLERLMGNDFSTFHSDYFGRILFAIVLFKLGLLALETKLWLQMEKQFACSGTSDVHDFKIFFRVLSQILIPCYSLIEFHEQALENTSACKRKKEEKCISLETCHESSLHLDHLIIFLNLVMFVLLPLMALYPVFSNYYLTYSPQENWIIFAIIVLCNCLCYLGSIYWKSGLWLLFFGSDFHDTLWDLIGPQFGLNFTCQLAFLSVICFQFHLLDNTAQEFLVFTLAWLLSDFAVLLYLCRLTIATRKKVFQCKRFLTD